MITRMIPTFVGRTFSTIFQTPDLGPVVPQICIVGSGPAGFYCAQGLLKAIPGCCVDIFEKLPVPFGLIRYGVAPDHQDVKKVVNTFTRIAHNDNVSFYGNVTIGKDIRISDLLAEYHSVILCTGAEESRSLGISGESLENVLSAKEVVGWYNGSPDNAKLRINLDTENVVILGHGNVALDIGRILLMSVDELKGTDITERALEALSRSRVKKVFLIGRRGPLQASFTIKELREMMRLRGCRGVFRQEDLSTINEELLKGFGTAVVPKNATNGATWRLWNVMGLPRPRRRIMELIVNYNIELHDESQREWEVVFYRSPLEFISTTFEDDRKLTGIRLAINKLQIQNDNIIATQMNNKTEILDCGLAIKSIGYTSVPLEDLIPFNNLTGTISNEEGRVMGKPGLYCCGWAATGSIGVILTTVDNSFRISRTVSEDIVSGHIEMKQRKQGSVNILSNLEAKGVKVITFKHWEIIDAEERKRGTILGKPREKIVDIEEMVKMVKC